MPHPVLVPLLTRYCHFLHSNVYFFLPPRYVIGTVLHCAQRGFTHEKNVRPSVRLSNA